MYVSCINNLKQQKVEFCCSCRCRNTFSTTFSHCGAMHAVECAPCMLSISVVQACVNALYVHQSPTLQEPPSPPPQVVKP